MLDYRGRRDAFDAAFAGPAGALRDAERLHADARRSIAAAALERACRAYDRGKTGGVPVEELVSFALESTPEARGLRQWRALERRRALGADRVPRDPRFIARSVARRVVEELGRRRWLRTGEW
jgi:hypothetical protein